MRVHHAGDGVVVHVAGKARHVLDGGNALLLGLVCQHGSRDDVADGPHAGGAGLELVVDLHTAKAVGGDAVVLQVEALCEGAAAGGHQHDVHVQLLGVTAGAGLDGQSHTAVGDLGLGDLVAQHELEALLLEELLVLLRDLAVHGRHDAIQELDDGHLRTQAVPHRSHLQTNHAATDDSQLLRHLLQRQGAGGVDDAAGVVVDGARGQRRHLGARGDEDVLGVEHLLTALGEVGGNLVGAGELSPALHVVHAVLLEQKLDAAGELAHRLVLGAHHLAQVEVHVLDCNVAHQPK